MEKKTKQAVKKQNVFTIKNKKKKTIDIIKTVTKVNIKKHKNVYPNCILTEDSSHLFTARSLPGSSFIAFRISLVPFVHSFKTDFIF